MFYCFLVVRIMAPLTHARMNEHSKQHHQRARCRVSQPVTGRVDVSPPFNGRTFEQPATTTVSSSLPLLFLKKMATGSVLLFLLSFLLLSALLVHAADLYNVLER